MRPHLGVTGAAPQYNGNINSIEFCIFGRSGKETFAFAYDELDRLKEMYYPQSQDNDENDFNVSIAYADGTGNIQSIVRNGLVDVNSLSGVKTFGLMDDLSFNYIGGQLASVTESANGSFGFRGSGGNFSYEYGRMTQGPGLGQATYNPLGLPSTVVSPEGDQLLVKYDAEGVKWYQRKVGGSYVPPAYGSSNGIEEKVYSFGLESINGEYLVSYFDHGRTIIDQAGSREAIEYYLKDHLGNISAVTSDLNDDGVLDLESSTYPSELLSVHNYYSRRDLGASTEEPLARPNPAGEGGSRRDLGASTEEPLARPNPAGEGDPFGMEMEGLTRIIYEGFVMKG